MSQAVVHSHPAANMSLINRIKHAAGTAARTTTKAAETALAITSPGAYVATKVLTSKKARNVADEFEQRQRQGFQNGNLIPKDKK